MKTRQIITKEVGKELIRWFIKHRQPITPRSLKPILLKHITPEIGIEAMTNYLLSKEGRRVWHKAMRDELKVNS